MGGFRRRGDCETGRLGDWETWRWGDLEMGRRGDWGTGRLTKLCLVVVPALQEIPSKLGMTVPGRMGIGNADNTDSTDDYRFLCSS